MTKVTKSGKKESMSASCSTSRSRGRVFCFRVQEACRSRKVVIILAAKFVFFLGALNGLLLAPAGRAVVDWISQANARISAALLEFCGIGTEVQNTTIFSDSSALTVLGGCSAVEVWFFLVAAILAFHCSARRKIVGLCASLALVQGINLLRITTLFWLTRLSSHSFEIAHEAIWPTLLNLSAIVFLGFWLAWATKIPTKQ
jgi:exosortase/archaeosortase family protein